jgi:acyl-CoA thioesterase-2
MSNTAHDNTGALAGLLSVLDIEPMSETAFLGRSPRDGWQRVYGGQVLGQALVAAGRTVDEKRAAHSLHAHFLIGGEPLHPIDYDVERTRDGRSFSTRRVRASQHDRLIFTMTASFHVPEDGFDHEAEMPKAPPPDELPAAEKVMAPYMNQLPEVIRRYWMGERPIEMRPVDMSRYLDRRKRRPQQLIWLRANGKLPDDLRLHQSVLAYASDFTLLDTALIAHGRLLFDSDLQLASLDHALWFHRPFRADDWILYAQDSPSAYGGRGFCRGSMFSREGHLIASTAQEGVMRKKQI